MACFLIRGDIILPEKELHRSLHGGTQSSPVSESPGNPEQSSTSALQAAMETTNGHENKEKKAADLMAGCLDFNLGTILARARL